MSLACSDVYRRPMLGCGGFAPNSVRGARGPSPASLAASLRCSGVTRIQRRRSGRDLARGSPKFGRRELWSLGSGDCLLRRGLAEAARASDPTMNKRIQCSLFQIHAFRYKLAAISFSSLYLSAAIDESTPRAGCQDWWCLDMHTHTDARLRRMLVSRMTAATVAARAAPRSPPVESWSCLTPQVSKRRQCCEHVS